MIAATSLQTLAERGVGHLLGRDVAFQNVSIDSRTLAAGDLYIALPGEQFDGHDFIPDAVEKGCCAAVVEKPMPVTVPQLVSPDARRALGEVGAVNRALFTGKVVAITGSAGKTTCKNLLHSIFASCAATCVTQGNLNNEIGVPLTLLQLTAEHRYAVVEMGARKPGDIAYLGQFVQPDIAVLLNAGSAHIEVFGSYQNIVNTKGEIFDALSESGCGIVNLDDPAADVWLARLGERRHLAFSLESKRGDVWVEEVQYGPAITECMLCTSEAQHALRLRAPGKAVLSNALAAAAAALAAGVGLADIAAGLARYAPSEGRLQRRQLPGGPVLIDDSYNANPVSMKAALDVLALQGGRRIAVLGEMAELGDESRRFHCEVAEHARDLGVEHVVLIGPYAQEMASILGANAVVATNESDLWRVLRPELRGEEVVLIKGSRCARLERIVERLAEEFS